MNEAPQTLDEIAVRRGERLSGERSLVIVPRRHLEVADACKCGDDPDCRLCNPPSSLRA